MNMLKCVVLSILIGSNIASAKIRVEGISYNNVTLKMSSKFIVASSETKAHYYDDMRLEVTLAETNIIIFDLAQKDESNSYISFYRTAIVSPEKEAEVGFASTKGSILKVLVTEI